MDFFDFFAKPSKPILGMDISSSAVKLIELSKAGDSFKVEAYRVLPLPPNTIVDKNIADLDALSETIAAVVKRSGSKLTDIVAAVSSSSVITKEIELPAGLTELQMEMQIEVEADQYIPYPMEEVAFDFDVLGEAENNPDLVRVLLAACRQENVEHRRQAIEMAGFNPKVIDVESFAVERAYKLIEGQLDEVSDQVVAIADIGASVFSFTVLVDGKIIYSREQQFGGKELTEEIQRRYGLSWEEAGEAKRKGGLPEDYATEVLAPFKESLVQHITRSLQFFYSSSHFNYVDQLFLAGGVSALEGLVDEVEQVIGLPTAVANPFANMQLHKSINPTALANDAPAMLLAVGLAMRSFD
ncbi:pilus assembly protein PilM [SAR92 clade bacterium H455]|uniref:Pilus assembly protein PilM n=1 Tax=SAR92 clade bacterium H455 TaxID=2974818 RepID=A0ABY5TR20_9GAMM|nr:pilus assembly protein PilM [SAR92 clade bacterium H455]